MEVGCGLDVIGSNDVIVYAPEVFHLLLETHLLNNQAHHRCSNNTVWKEAILEMLSS
jgi:hypothetical protein